MTFMNVSLSAPVARAADTTTDSLGVVGARFVLDGVPSQGRFSLVEHPIVARGMTAPLHRHTREDEYSFILEGRWGFWQDSDIAFAEPGDLVYKPRDVWHTFWNATDRSARLLEIISPAGFDQFFAELAALIGSGQASPQTIGARSTPRTGSTSIRTAPLASRPNIAWLRPCPHDCNAWTARLAARLAGFEGQTTANESLIDGLHLRCCQRLLKVRCGRKLSLSIMQPSANSRCQCRWEQHPFSNALRHWRGYCVARHCFGGGARTGFGQRR
jgi:mannose-6-phosphate isomerase-like protein (cupin superfamily)